MARYIDADKLIKTLFPIGLIDDGKYTINAKAVKYAIDNTPTADVVPKSEYDEVLSNWQKIHDSYNSDCIEHYKYGRAEVAREIFEEIEEIIQYSYYVDELGEWHDETLLLGGIDELKNKYVEGDNG